MHTFLSAGCLGAILLLAGCGDAPTEAAQMRAPIEDAAQALPPAIVAPMDIAEPGSAPSFEVGIATAASDRNHAKEKCAELPKTEREACEAAADAAFESAQSELEDLRGNQQ
ncbi:MAG: hypothetical protein WD944_06080 [Steroidobacteraceae bacterium]